MLYKRNLIIEKELHQSAMDRISHYVSRFASTLALLAKTEAFKEKADIVLNNHVDSAHILIFQRRKSTLRKFGRFIGAAFFGAFLQGQIYLYPYSSPFPLIINVAIGIIGIFLYFLCT